MIEGTTIYLILEMSGLQTMQFGRECKASTTCANGM
jgi:hypothetical protein